MISIPQRIAEELKVRLPQVEAAIGLLDDKSTVPFIARYRKEATGGLDDTQLRTLEERLTYLRELDDRRAAIVRSIDEQGKLTPELAASIEQADTKARLEDLYLPFKQKRRTKAQIAREAGLEPLATRLLQDATLVPEREAAAFVDMEKGIADASAALEGARWILMESFAEDAEQVGGLRQLLWERGEWKSTVVAGKEEEGAKFSDYFSASELVRNVPSHRTLALLRGRNEGFLRLAVVLPDELGAGGPTLPERRIAARAGIENRGRAADAWLAETVRWTWKVKLLGSLEVDVEGRLREQAEAEAIRVFGRNLQDLLLAAPAGQRVTMGLDPGIRTGVKVAVVDGTGKLLDATAVYPHEPRKDWEGSLRVLGQLCAQHGVQLISIGNGTASRETDKLAGDLIARHPDLRLTKVVVSEAGASVYSASELAAQEFPNLDVSLRGAVSIARRLQDPLAELVRIEPKAIGVGQYQHDVNQGQLSKKLDAVVEDCVNAVGADVNTASAPLLARISGLSTTTAKNIVSFRDANGPFRNRRRILDVPRLGERTFQQAAGFLRISDGDNPLDASSVHPESYPVVERIVARTGVPVPKLIGNAAVLRTLTPESLSDGQFGIPTVKDILAELEKPGRDPRPEFKTAAFKDGVNEMSDLQPGMLLEGVVTNVANFGAFVDVGVHQDGLVHVSQLADRFIKDPREVVKAGDIVKVRVVEVDRKRRRIALTMKLQEAPAARGTQAADAKPAPAARKPLPRQPAPQPGARPAAQSTSMAAAFAKLGKDA
ncbi:MAG: RNA-binding transcriptional accessory protein [Acidobacteriota bacterium]|nr:RNA-binding transcriptional accessory protein [Acidobacteriota bacterium]